MIGRTYSVSDNNFLYFKLKEMQEVIKDYLQ